MLDFEKYKLGKITRQKFIDLKNSIDEEIKTTEDKIDEMKKAKEEVE